MPDVDLGSKQGPEAMCYPCFRGKDDIQGPSAGLVLGLVRPEVERPLSFWLGPWAPWTVCAEMPE